jgi:uncharacterized membrane protein
VDGIKIPAKKNMRYERKQNRFRSTWGAGLIGVGVMAGIDEIIFHQLLAWHHFYDRSTTEIALISDGLLHAVELIAIVAGFFVLFDLSRTGTLAKPRALAGFFIGLGVFQLFDGFVNHKVLRLHQIRDVVDILPYDIAWNAAGVLLFAAGLLLLKRALTLEQEERSS